MCLGWLPTDNYFRVKENRDGERGDTSLGLWREMGGREEGGSYEGGLWKEEAKPSHSKWGRLAMPVAA